MKCNYKPQVVNMIQKYTCNIHKLMKVKYLPEA